MKSFFLLGILLGFFFIGSASASFTVDTTNLVKEMNTGEADFFPPIVITNNGNVTIDITTEIDATPQLVFAPNLLSIPINSSLSVSISAVVPINTEPNDYLNVINFSSINQFHILNVEIEVRDSISPTISGCGLSTINTNRTRQINVNCQDIRDNVEVENVFVTVADQIVDLNKDGNSYSSGFVISTIGDHNTTLFARDETGNEANFTLPTITITDFNPIQTDNLDFQNVRVGIDHVRPFATIVETANISVRIDRMSYDENTTGTLDYLVFDTFGGGRSIPIGETISFSAVKPGDMSIRIKGDQLGTFSGSISMFFEEKEYSMNLKGIMSIYTIEPNRTFIWFGNPAWCAGFDAGSLQNSSNICVFNFPVSQTLNGTEFPVNFQLYNDLNLGTYDQTLTKLQELEDSELLWKIFGIIAVAVMGLVIFYFGYWEGREE